MILSKNRPKGGGLATDVREKENDIVLAVHARLSATNKAYQPC